MKMIIICLLGFIIYQSNDARVVISDGLQFASDAIESTTESKSQSSFKNPFKR